MIENPVITRIRNEVERTPVVVFLAGTAMWPGCPGSAAVAHHLAELGVAFRGIDVTTDPELRAGLQSFADLAEVPQVYIKGDLLGGAEVVRELAESGELAALLREQGIALAS